ncbi:response regulator [Fulvimarina sp. MAC3]|uniref:response regulator n=1 Tax=Fulvimarina sp. MAC3 TaxID=3148887 RepID=UPI0031FD1DE9
MATCLLFDEMPIVRKIGERILAKADYEVTVVETLAAAQAHIAAAGIPDLAILSGTGGNSTVTEFVKAIREDRGAGRRAVILVSIVERNIGLLMRLRRAGANGILMKPFDADGFTETLHIHKRAAELAA